MNDSTGSPYMGRFLGFIAEKVLPKASRTVRNAFGKTSLGFLTVRNAFGKTSLGFLTVRNAFGK
ncbi:MAG: hypothetical protein AAF560_09485, partial [Acidobacteriota bacterium]